MIQLRLAQDYQPEPQGVLVLANDADAHDADLQGITTVVLHFPKYTDGRAFSQAQMLRRRGFTGTVRATGDVLVDQLLQMQRCGFSEAVLRQDQNLQVAQRLLQAFSGFYQADAQEKKPLFAR